jgi:hypothetical protein
MPMPITLGTGRVLLNVANSYLLRLLNPTAGATFAHPANTRIEFTVAALPVSGNIDLFFRKQDATNYWRVAVGSTGNFTLLEVVAGAGTTRGTANGVMSSGHRVVIIATGSVITGYSNGVLRWTYSSASNFATATTGEISSLGTGGSISVLEVYNA